MKTEYTAQEKSAILGRFILHNIPPSELCDEYDIPPERLREWREDLVENSIFAFRYAENLKARPKRTRWHELLGRLLEELLTPLEIDVHTGLPVMAFPPEADIVIIRRKGEKWTPEQRAVLPDGIREVDAPCIILEFKYTQSTNEKAFTQALIYDSLYKASKKLDADKVRTFLVSSKSPRQEVLEESGYSATETPGVYKTNAYLLNAVVLIDLNKLPDEPHNAFIKFFASRKNQKNAAFETLSRLGLEMLSSQLQWLVRGLYRYWFKLKGVSEMDAMDDQLTPEELIKAGKILEDSIINSLSIERRLEGVPDDELLKRIPDDELLKRLSDDKLLRRIPDEKRLKGIPDDKLLKGIPDEKRLKGIPDDKLLKRIPAQVIKAYLDRLDNEGPGEE